MKTLGLDVGGATLKAATSGGEARSRKFALWKQPERLTDEIQAMIAGFRCDRAAVVMTGELCDCFETRRAGVRHIVQSVRSALTRSLSLRPCEIGFWNTGGEFASPETALTDEIDRVQAANWHALATWTARTFHCRNGLLIDIGSTTTDIIPIADGRPATHGMTDAGRLASGELVYLGVERTPVCAILREAKVDGIVYRTMAEWFASTADAYIALGDLPENPDFTDTADGRPATAFWSRNRLARVIGMDHETLTRDRILQIAADVKLAVESNLSRAVETVVGRMTTAPETIFIAGQGEIVAQAVCREVAALRQAKLVSIAESMGPEVSRAACAFAAASLMAG